MVKYDPDPQTDKWYAFKGVPLPVRTTHGLTEDEIDDFLKKNQHECKFQQKGNEVFCEEGGYRHGHFVNPRLKPKYREA